VIQNKFISLKFEKVVVNDYKPDGRPEKKFIGTD
jgi:hypothetical protein